MRILRLRGALAIVERLLISTIIIAMVLASSIAPVCADNSPMTTDTIILDSISDKAPGDIVTISGTTTFGEISIKVHAPNNIILYVSTVTGGNFTKTLTLPNDAVPGIYEVVAGVGLTVATTTFKVETTAPLTITSLDEVSVVTKAGTVPVLPVEVTARYSDGSSKNVAVVWDEIDPLQYASVGTFTTEGTVEGTDIKAKAVVTVEEDVVPPTITGIDEVSVTTKAGKVPVLPEEVTARYSDGSSKNVAVVWDEIGPSQYASAGTFTVEGTVEGTDIKAKAIVTVIPVVVDEVKLYSIADKAPGDTVTITGTTTFTEITIKVLAPNKTILYVSIVAGGNFTEMFTLPNDAEPGIYEVVAGVGSIVATATFKVGTTAPPTITDIDEVSVITKEGKVPVLPEEVTARYSDGSSKNVAVVWDKIDPSQYASAGTFTVEGTIERTDIKAKATVTVTAATGGGGVYIPPIQTEDDLTEIEAKPDSSGVCDVQFGKGSLKKAIENAEDGIARLKITGTEDAIEVLINIPAEDLNQAIDKGIRRIEIESDQTVFSINPEILKNSKEEYPSNIELTIKKVDTSTLSEEVRSMVEDNTVYDLSLNVDKEKLSSFEKGDMVISMNYTLKPEENPNKVVVYYIGESGNIEVVTNGKYSPETDKVEFKPKQMGMYTVAYADVTFSDISNVKWANEAIEALAAREVISGLGDGTFRPNDKVTRAEFIKMLMIALELADEDAECTFSDVKNGAWYYEPIAVAEKLGIANGKPDGSFGVNEEILRQDMAVMVYRAALSVGMDLGDDADSITFTDEADVSGYAKEAVSAIQKAGIINGIGDGSFAPKNDATRAEAAVIIYSTISSSR